MTTVCYHPDGSWLCTKDGEGRLRASYLGQLDYSDLCAFAARQKWRFVDFTKGPSEVADESALRRSVLHR